jgi:tetratricopeptide (TPR) repeat protein
MTQPETKPTIPQSERPTDVDNPAEAEGTAAEPEPEPEPWTPERVTEWNAYYDLFVMLSVLTLAFFASFNKIAHSSIWNQLQVGRLIAANHAPVTTDPFSFTEPGKTWVNVPWLFDWAGAVVFKVASDLAPSDPTDPTGSAAKAEQYGAGALVAVTALIRLLTALFLLAIRRSGPGRWWSAVCVALALGAIWSPAGLLVGGVAGPGLVAPGTWGLLLFAVELWLLHRATALGRRGAAFALVPLFALWANVDESFLIGLLVLAAAAVGRLMPERPRSGEEAGGLGLPTALGVLAASALACLANPATFHVYRAGLDPLLSVFRPATDVVTIDQLSYFGPGIKLEAPDGYPALRAYYVLLVALGLGSFLLNRRRFSLGRFLVFALVAALWAVLIRFATEFAVVWAATMALNGQEWYQDSFGTEGRLGWQWSLWSVGGRAVTIVVVFAVVARVLTGYGAAFGESRFGFGFDPDDFAFEAADYLKSSPIKGNVLNTTIAQGDALVWRAYPVRKTYVDSRPHLFPPEVLNELQKARQALKEDDADAWKPLLDRYQISAVMINPASARNTYKALSLSENWVPFYDDGQVVMFGRADAPASDLAYFNQNRLDPESRAYKVARPIPPTDRPPSPVTWMDTIFQGRSQNRPQPHTESALRWLAGPDYDPTVPTLPDPARCLLAVREARTALASKPDDTHAFRLLADAYRALTIQETALLAGLKLTPENAAQVNQLNPRPDVLMTRFRQRVTALSYAIQTTPPPRSAADRRDAQRLNLELFQLFMSANFLDLARDRLQSVLDKAAAGDFTPEGRIELAQQLAQLNERVNQLQGMLSEQSADPQASPVRLASLLVSQGAPGMAIHELEEADRTGTNPALVKPQLIDLYCDTGQPEKAIEMFSTGTINDPSFGAEPGLAAVRQGRAYFLLGNDEYGANLLERWAIPALRHERGMRAVAAASSLVKGEAKGATSAFLEIPEKVLMQAQWEFEAGLYRLEAGTPETAAEHFTKALTLGPNLAIRPVIAYYLEKLGKPVPPTTSEAEKAKAGGEKPEEKPAANPEEEKKGDEAKK